MRTILLITLTAAILSGCEAREGSGNTDERIEVLEAQVRYLKDRVSDLESSVDDLESRTDV